MLTLHDRSRNVEQACPRATYPIHPGLMSGKCSLPGLPEIAAGRGMEPISLHGLSANAESGAPARTSVANSVAKKKDEDGHDRTKRNPLPPKGARHTWSGYNGCLCDSDRTLADERGGRVAN